MTKVLVSVGFGAGFSTDFSTDFRQNGLKLATDPRVVEAFEKKGPNWAEWRVKRYLGNLGYHLISATGWRNLVVVEVPAGVVFRIKEYDGAESVEIFNPDEWALSSLD